MLRRLLLGLVIGLVVGGLVAAAFVEGLHVTVFEGGAGAAFAYAAAAVVGVITGLFAGKPIWASDAKLEAGLKAFFGALLAVGGMFALRQWGAGWNVDLPSVGAVDLGKGAFGDLPATALPLIAAVLGGLFELDNTGDPERHGASPKRGAPKAPDTRKRVQAPGANGVQGKGRVSASAADDEASLESEARRSRR